MNKINPLSHITTLPEFDIFTVPPTQLTIEKTIVTEHRPLASITSNNLAAITISANSSVDEYIHLNETLLYFKLKVNIAKKNGTTTGLAATDWEKIQPVNNLLHSLFKRVELEINGKSITLSSKEYSYKAFFENFLGFTDNAKEGYLSSIGWYYDEVYKTEIKDTQSKLIAPTTFNANGSGKSIVLMGKLNLDLAFQPRALLGGVKLKFTLEPNEPNFYLWNRDDTLSAKVDFEDCVLYITRSKINRSIVEAHNIALTKCRAKYPIMRGVVKTFTINSNINEMYLDNCITGQIPRRVFVALVDHEAATGSLKCNPYNFEHFNVNYMTLSVDGVQHPSIAYTPDFANKLYAREHIGLYNALNLLSTDSNLNINYSEYSSGNTVFGFNLAPDPTDDCNKVGYVNPTQFGAMRLHLKFSQALTKNINVIMYCEYDNLVEIDSAREAFIDYN